MRLSIERSPSIETLGSLGLNDALRDYRPPAPVSRPPRRSRRNFTAAKINRLNKDLFGSSQSLGPHVYRSLRTLRSNSRKMARNNDWYIKFLRMCRVNVIGPEGMTFEAQAKTSRGKMDNKVNDLVEQHWQIWSYPENASANQRLSWHDIQLKWITTLARDGEVMFRKVPADNPYGFALKQIDVAWLDETYNEKLPNGNRVIMSVEIDDNDRHVAYYLTPPADAFYAGLQPAVRKRTRVLADEIYFDFIPFDQNCGDETVTRGVPWLHAAMIKLWTIGEFEYSAVVAARIGASKLGFYQNRQGDPLIMTKEEMERSADGRGPSDLNDDDDEEEDELLDHCEPGVFTDIGNKEFKEWNPTYPSEVMKPFLGWMLHGVAASGGTEYFSFASDFTEVNFSAGRLGVDQEHDNWMILHSPARNRGRGVHLDWLKSSMLKGAFALDPRDLVRLQMPKITCRGWGLYDPTKDIAAFEAALRLGVANRTDFMAKQGKDFSKNLATLKSEDEEAAAAGMDLSPAKPGAAAPPAASADSTDNPKDPKDPNGDTESDGG